MKFGVSLQSQSVLRRTSGVSPARLVMLLFVGLLAAGGAAAEEINLDAGDEIKGAGGSAQLRHNRVEIELQDGRTAKVSRTGNLKIDGDSVSLSDHNRQLLADYYAAARGFEDSGEALGKQGFSFAMHTLADVFTGAVTGDEAETEKRAKRGARAIKGQADKLCDRLDDWRVAQNRAADVIEAFKPYAVLTPDQISKCRKGLTDDDDEGADEKDAEDQDTEDQDDDDIVVHKGASQAGHLTSHADGQAADDADEAARKSSHGVNIDVSDSSADGAITLQHRRIVVALRNQGVAVVDAQGRLSINEHDIKLSGAGEEALAGYYRLGVDVIQTGKAVHREGLSTVLSLIAKGIIEHQATNDDKSESSDEFNGLASKVTGLCDQLEQWRQSQNAAADLVAEFKPYAVIAPEKVEQCRQNYQIKTKAKATAETAPVIDPKANPGNAPGTDPATTPVSPQAHVKKEQTSRRDSDEALPVEDVNGPSPRATTVPAARARRHVTLS